MRIGINALFIQPGKLGGGEVYFRNLFSALTKVDRVNEYFVFVNKKVFNDLYVKRGNVCFIVCNLGGFFKPIRFFWEQFILPFQLKKHKIDVVHSFSQTGLIFNPCKSIMTIHDLQHHYYPDNFSLWKRWYLKLLIYLTSKGSDKIITISKNSKNDILKILKVPKDKVEVIYESSRYDNNLVTINNNDKNRIRKKYSIDKKYILSIASLLPHKNLERLICSFAKLPLNDGCQLVLVGLKMKSWPLILKQIQSLGLTQNQIRILGYVPDEELPILYSMAEVFVYPSLFEGFGLPLLEAMVFGCPVLAANSTSIPEVVGDAALLADPLDCNDLANKIMIILKDKKIRDNLIKKGFKRINHFSWEKSAHQVLKVYENIIN